MHDDFRPRSQPAQRIYDVIIEKAKERDECDDWQENEIKTVASVARAYAQQHGKRIPLIDEIRRAEQRACGYTDYAAKWAYGVADLLRREADKCHETYHSR